MGSVRLVWITPDAENIVAYCARVSNPSNQDNPNIAGLIKYCINSGHWSILEQANLCVEVKTSRAISAQILRHRSFSFQEFSQRYSEVGSTEPIELRKQATKNRQSSTEVFNPVIPERFANRSAGSLVQEHISLTNQLYTKLLAAGIAKECARMILPMASSTTLYVNGTLRSWTHYLNLRCDEHTQLEHQLVAREIKKIFITQLPIVSEALGWLNEYNS